MGYRIMYARKKNGCMSLWRYITRTINKTIRPVEFDSLEDLDAWLEPILNSGEYGKVDLMVVKAIDYDIDIVNYSDGDLDSSSIYIIDAGDADFGEQEA